MPNAFRLDMRDLEYIDRALEIVLEMIEELGPRETVRRLEKLRNG